MIQNNKTNINADAENNTPSDLTKKIVKEVEEEAMLETFLENKETSDMTMPQNQPSANEQLLSCACENLEGCPEDSSVDKAPEKSADGEKMTKEQPSKPFSKEVEAIKVEIDSEDDPDKKLKIAIDKMESYLSMGKSPQFKNFWEVRKLCLELFKLNISQSVRSSLWAKYSELSKEARRLKEILDEQSAFAVEQIDIAITAIEKDIEQLEKPSEHSNAFLTEFNSKSLEHSLTEYQRIQNMLNVLNAHATRVNNLRKELIKIDMRIKFKNKFFQRLSAIGDKVFPQRKEFIKDISERFIKDVDEFIKTYFNNQQTNENVFFLREEIKALQGVAKALTLNTQSFTQTRKRLSECWDTLKVVDKERKKERAEKREVFQQNKTEIDEKIKAVKEDLEQGTISMLKAGKLLDELQGVMRNKELGRDEVKVLRNQIAELRKTIKDALKVEEDARLKVESDKLLKKRSMISELQQKNENLLASAPNMTADQIEEQKNAILAEIAAFKELTGKEKSELERPLRPLRDLISLKKEEEVMSLSDDDQNTLQNLREILRQRQQRRKEIKEQLDSLRRAAGNSGFDFEQAMNFNEQVNLEKERLEKSDEGIREIEEKIKSFKKA